MDAAAFRDRVEERPLALRAQRERERRIVVGLAHEPPDADEERRERDGEDGRDDRREHHLDEREAAPPHYHGTLLRLER